MSNFDFILVGGGLQNGLIALALAQQRPEARVAIIEKDMALGGNHTWSFHVDDVPPGARGFVDPLVQYRWPAYTVSFPSFDRRLLHSYASLTSARLHEVVRLALSTQPWCELMLGCEALQVSAHQVTLADGRTLSADLVIDARGPTSPGPTNQRVGYQKFLGLELLLETPASLACPIVMDATVPQTDGFRFIYALPLAPQRMLVEDTYFSDNPDLDVPRLRYEVLTYALEQQGVRVREVVRQETGVLPLPLRGGDGPWLPQPDAPLQAGYGGGFFHPATGYSFPLAVRLAEHIATTEPSQLLGGAFARLVREHRRQARFCHLLNRLLFLGIAEPLRWTALARFYGLPEDTIRRFYALTMTRMDRTRILFGRPPKGLSLRGVMAALEV